jgi:hypothetical protein
VETKRRCARRRGRGRPRRLTVRHDADCSCMRAGAGLANDCLCAADGSRGCRGRTRHRDAHGERAVDESREQMGVIACRGQRAGAGVERREQRMKGGFKGWQVVGSVLRYRVKLPDTLCGEAFYSVPLKGGRPRARPLGGHSITPKFAKLDYKPATQI